MVETYHIEELVESVTVLPDHLEVTVSGAPRLQLRCQEVGLNLETHRIRIESRQRSIPDWYELDWERVQRSRSSWDFLAPADLILQATDSVEANGVLLAALIHNG